jgi:hypothetical protein
MKVSEVVEQFDQGLQEEDTATRRDAVMPPDGTTTGCRYSDGSMWTACCPEPEKKPGIAVCLRASNWVNPPSYSLVAVFECEADRDFVLELHRRYLTGGWS